MDIYKFNHRGTEINKIQFSEIEHELEQKGFDVDFVFDLIADRNEYVFVSNGFIRGLLSEKNEKGEWHHFFKKCDDGDFTAEKLSFNL